MSLPFLSLEESKEYWNHSDKSSAMWKAFQATGIPAMQWVDESDLKDWYPKEELRKFSCVIDGFVLFPRLPTPAA